MPNRVLIARELADLFKLLAHPDRIRLIEELGAGEKAVNELGDSTGLPSARVSQHLALLRAHRVVDERRDGRHRYYHLVQPGFAAWIVDGLDFVAGREQVVDAAKIRAVRRQWPATPVAGSGRGRG
ncbi:MAG: winged helix-turn-helix transcriptional regulator [Gammaproteobacteria bacterium]|nr:winged helix-turn-helix transcriptional regulator [Gammaproteobacteria bacterium]MCP5199992.1 winged helix-turn-helix transcriptional regulator [Gammaproteobacteria bacterium]